MLYWKVGRRVRKDILGNERSPYGKEIVQTVSGQLVADYGKGFSRSNLFNMVRFSNISPKPGIVATLSLQLGWSHFIEIIPIEDSLKRDFYSEMCRIERWSVRTLRAKIDSMLFERTALSKKPKKLIQQEIDTLRKEDQMTPDLVFRDPYFLDFLGLKGSFSEKDVESAILRELEKFILELGTDFTFVDRQKRMTIGGEDFYLDLLFYHRRLRRLVVFELKLGKFQAGDKGQMELYLRWLEKYEKREGEESPLGLILCSEKSQEQVSLLKLDHGEIRVAEYLTELPSQEVFEKKLHDAISIAKEQLTVNGKGSS